MKNLKFHFKNDDFQSFNKLTNNLTVKVYYTVSQTFCLPKSHVVD
jgi:hypothetical protein